MRDLSRDNHSDQGDSLIYHLSFIMRIKSKKNVCQKFANQGKVGSVNSIFGEFAIESNIEMRESMNVL